MLGFVFSPKPNPDAQLQHLIRKANKTFFVIVKHKRNGLPNDKLREIYTSVLRSVLEYSNVVYHSMLNKHQENLLEKIQKRALRAIYGYKHNYEELLRMSGLPTLKGRRETAFAKFASKSSKNPKYKDKWFPLRSNPRQTRSNNPYLEEQSTGNRLYKSPLFTMRRLLNNNTEDTMIDLTGLFNSP